MSKRNTCVCGKPSQPSRSKCSACRTRERRADPEKRAKESAWRRARRAQLGPSGSAHKSPPIEVADGLELRAQTTHVNPDGTLRSRYDKTALARQDEPSFSPVPAGHHVTKTTTRIDADGRVGMQYVTAQHDAAARELAMFEAWQRHAALYKGLAEPAAPPAITDADLLTIYPLGDPHIGMLAWAPESGDHFDLKIACRELLACVRLMIEGAPPSKHAIITNLGDFFHSQDESQRTPGHGHKLDVEGRWSKVLDAGHATLRGLVDAALTKHEHVTVRNLPGNHDPRVAVELMYWLRAVYEREPRVTIADAYAPVQYDTFGRVLLGWAHGDRAKMSELLAIMATDMAEAWGRATTRDVHTGHVHHENEHEHPGGRVFSHRTLAARDSYHAGRYRAGRSLKAITYHKDHGEIARNMVGLSRVRAALGSPRVGSVLRGATP